jgi:hypothetical protein
MIGITALLDGKLGREAARDENRQHVLEVPIPRQVARESGMMSLTNPI